MNDPPSFASLLDIHEALEEIFALHQEALLLTDFPAALELLTIHSELLRVHMDHEESFLLPVFERAGPVEKWPRVLYTGQHEKMRGMLERADASLRTFIDNPPTRPRRAVIGLMDFETTYKHLVEHHDGAEREGLFPIADAAASAEERRSLIEKFRREWDEALATHKARIVELRSGLEARED